MIRFAQCLLIVGHLFLNISILLVQAAAQPAAAQQDIRAHQPQIAALKSAIAARLSVMTDVARYKWNQDLAINAPEREAKVIDATTKRAVAMDLEPALARRAVTAQMEASKALQRNAFARWRAEGAGKFADVPSLGETIRPQIDQLTGAFLAALSQSQTVLQFCSIQGDLLVPAEGISPDVWQLATMGLLPPGPCTPDRSTRE